MAVPYVVFETAYSLFTRWSSQDPDRPITLRDPLLLTWYVAALFIWKHPRNCLADTSDHVY
uniref:hypothetical protein n=1 Tax=Streptomyces nigra TaxID=1827580 RepID=UPI0035E0FEAD